METIRRVYTEQEVKEFSATLSTTDPINFTRDDIKAISKFINSDGCTGVPDIFKPACIEHDFYYRTHLTFTGMSLTRKEADSLFSLGMQRITAKKKLKLTFGILSFVYFLGVRIFGRFSWG